MSELTAPTRRQVLLTSGAVVAAAAVTAACGNGSGSSGGSATGPTVVKTADVPVGGGVIVPDAQVVVTQPTAGSFKAFTAVCTHQGCLVSSVAEGKITCACHGSVFSAADGSVLQSPASSPLAERTATVSGNTITVA
jgi:Rieske Fe-S protein